jgi:hypothetical protein
VRKGSPVSNRTLLEQQNELLRFLTSPEVIFGLADFQEAADDPFLGRIVIPHLRLEAEMSFQKRLDGIKRILRYTTALLFKEVDVLAQEFVTACPPKTSLAYDNALSFFHFLLEHWRSNPPSPECLPEVAKIEIALARARAFRRTSIDVPLRPALAPTGHTQYRIAPQVEFLNLEFDLRALFSTEISELQKRRSSFSNG